MNLPMIFRMLFLGFPFLASPKYSLKPFITLSAVKALLPSSLRTLPRSHTGDTKAKDFTGSFARDLVELCALFRRRIISPQACAQLDIEDIWLLETIGGVLQGDCAIGRYLPAIGRFPVIVNGNRLGDAIVHVDWSIDGDGLD